MEPEAGIAGHGELLLMAALWTGEGGFGDELIHDLYARLLRWWSLFATIEPVVTTGSRGFLS